MQINADNDGPTTGTVQKPAESAPRDYVERYCEKCGTKFRNYNFGGPMWQRYICADCVFAC